MSGSITIPFNSPRPVDPLARRAKRMLSEIQTYLDLKQEFGLTYLARVLMRRHDQAGLLEELVWLCENAYIAGSVSGTMRLTQQGKAYDSASEEEAAQTETD